MKAVNSISPVESNTCESGQISFGPKTEIVVGSNKLPKKLYRLIDAKGEDITETAVNRNELIDTILDCDDVRDEIKDELHIHGITSDEAEQWSRDYAEEIAEELGYRIVEVLK